VIAVIASLVKMDLWLFMESVLLVLTIALLVRIEFVRNAIRNFTLMGLLIVCLALMDFVRIVLRMSVKLASWARSLFLEHAWNVQMGAKFVIRIKFVNSVLLDL
jgi:hypothetical protein